MSTTCSNCGYKRPNYIKDIGLKCPMCETEYPKIKKPFLPHWALLTVIVIGSAIAPWLLDQFKDSKPTARTKITLAERYPGPWNTGYSLDIAKTLTANNIRGCGEFKYKHSSRNNGEYIVHCRGTSTEWKAYIVWVFSQGIQGPL